MCLQLADDVDRALAPQPLDLRLLEQLLLEDDALAAPRAFPQVIKDRRLARNADVVRPPLEVDRLVLVLKPLLDLDFRESEGRFFRHSQVVFDLSLFRSNMSLTENESVVL